MTVPPIGLPPNPEHQPDGVPGAFADNPAATAGQPTESSRGFNPENVALSDWLTCGSGLVALVFTFFGWYTGSGTVHGVSVGSTSIGAWNRWWILIPLLLLAVFIIRLLQVFAGIATKEIPGIALVAAGAAVVLLAIIALIDAFSLSISGIGWSAGPGFGIWAFIILALVFTYFLALSVQRTSKLPFKVPGPPNL